MNEPDANTYNCSKRTKNSAAWALPQDSLLRPLSSICVRDSAHTMRTVLCFLLVWQHRQAFHSSPMPHHILAQLTLPCNQDLTFAICICDMSSEQSLAADKSDTGTKPTMLS